MTMTMVKVNKVDVPRLTPDGRTVLAKLLNEFDGLYDAKREAETAFEVAKAAYDVLADDIKAQVALLTPAQKIQLDSDKLAYVLDCSTADRTFATKEGMAWLLEVHPDIHAKVTEKKPVTILKRLTGKLWTKRF